MPLIMGIKKSDEAPLIIETPHGNIEIRFASSKTKNNVNINIESPREFMVFAPSVVKRLGLEYTLEIQTPNYNKEKYNA